MLLRWLKNTEMYMTKLLNVCSIVEKKARGGTR